MELNGIITRTRLIISKITRMLVDIVPLRIYYHKGIHILSLSQELRIKVSESEIYNMDRSQLILTIHELLKANAVQHNLYKKLIKHSWKIK